MNLNAKSIVSLLSELQCCQLQIIKSKKLSTSELLTKLVKESMKKNCLQCAIFPIFLHLWCASLHPVKLQHQLKKVKLCLKRKKTKTVFNTAIHFNQLFNLTKLLLFWRMQNNEMRRPNELHCKLNYKVRKILMKFSKVCQISHELDNF